MPWLLNHPPKRGMIVPLEIIVIVVQKSNDLYQRNNMGHVFLSLLGSAEHIHSSILKQ